MTWFFFRSFWFCSGRPESDSNVCTYDFFGVAQKCATSNHLFHIQVACRSNMHSAYRIYRYVVMYVCPLSIFICSKMCFSVIRLQITYSIYKQRAEGRERDVSVCVCFFVNSIEWCGSFSLSFYKLRRCTLCMPLHLVSFCHCTILNFKISRWNINIHVDFSTVCSCCCCRFSLPF